MGALLSMPSPDAADAMINAGILYMTHAQALVDCYPESVFSAAEKDRLYRLLESEPYSAYLTLFSPADQTVSLLRLYLTAFPFINHTHYYRGAAIRFPPQTTLAQAATEAAAVPAAQTANAADAPTQATAEPVLAAAAEASTSAAASTAAASSSSEPDSVRRAQQWIRSCPELSPDEKDQCVRALESDPFLAYLLDADMPDDRKIESVKSFLRFAHKLRAQHHKRRTDDTTTEAATAAPAGHPSVAASAATPAPQRAKPELQLSAAATSSSGVAATSSASAAEDDDESGDVEFVPLLTKKTQ